MSTELRIQAAEVLGKRRGMNPGVLLFMQFPVEFEANLTGRGSSD